MAEQSRQTRTNDPLRALAEEQQQDFGVAGVAAGHNIMPTQQGDTAVNIFGGVISAQRVAVARDPRRFLTRMQELAAIGGESWLYRWQVNNRSTGSKDTIEGGSIKLANDLAREWGNCQVDIRVVDEGAHWLFYGRFVDLETGYSLTRPYQQRKGQNTGMKDQQRALDMVLQIGASKCIRNVVLNALQTYADYCMDLADNTIRQRVEKDPEAARNWIVKQVEKLGIDIKRVERTVGYTVKNFTVPIMAGLYAQIRSVTDGMVLADDIWPSDETLKQREKEGNFDPAKQAVAGQDASTKPDGTKKEEAAKDAPPAAAEEKDPPPEASTKYTVRNEAGTPVGEMEEAPEVGADIKFMDVMVHIIEVNNDTNTVTIKVLPPPKKETAAEKAAGAAKRAAAKPAAPPAAAPAAEKKPAAGPDDNLFND